MRRKRFELVQAPDAKTKDSDQPCAEIANAMPLLQHENAECGPIAGGGMQVLVESTPKEQALQQDEAIAARRQNISAALSPHARLGLRFGRKRQRPRTRRHR